MNLCGLIHDDFLRQRVADLAGKSGWSIWLAVDADDLVGMLTTLGPCPDVVLSDDPELFGGLPPSTATWIYLGDKPANSGAAAIAPSQSDGRLLRDIRTCVNARRFRARFAELERREPITNLPRHEELFASLTTCKGRPIGLIIVQLDHMEHLYANLDAVSKTDLLTALGGHIQRSIPSQGQLGFYDAGCFVIALPNIAQADMPRLCERLLQLVRKPIVSGSGEIHITMSGGYHFEAAFGNRERLWSAAWQAMELAQRAGGDAIYGNRGNSISERIPQALERDEFSLLLQGQWNLTQDRFTGVEALIRWQGMEVGELAPSHFIPIAEQSGHMARIGDWVLEQAGREAATWYQRLVDPLLLAINVSPQQFHQDAILKQIHRFSTEHWLDPGMLELELSQEGMLRLVDDHREQLYTLRDWGVRFALDNLGSTLIDTQKLLRCPVDTLKIDRELVANLADDPHAADLVGQICELGQRFNLRVVGVGVEAQTQMQELAHLGCSDVQGFLIAPPVPLNDFYRVLSHDATTQGGQ